MNRILIGIGAVVVIGVIAVILAVSFGMERTGDADNEATVAALVTPEPGLAGVVPGATPEDLSRIRCGHELWAKKTLADPAAASISPIPQDITVDQLVHLPSPDPRTLTVSRVAPVETTTYRLTVNLTQFRAEADGDLHIVVVDPAQPNESLIIEAPDAAHCSLAPANLRAQMVQARAAFLAAFGAPPSGPGFKRISGTATIVGIGLFDPPHGQTGRSLNNSEIHPLLQITVGK